MTQPQALVPHQVHVFMAGLPLWARALGALMVGELGFYWGHRWSHEVPFVRLCGMIPVYLLGLGTPLTPSGGAVSALLVIVSTLWGFLIHANLRWRFGPLEWLISTPAFHHWHHTRSEMIDRNYASMLPCMDWLFGTYHLPKAWPAEYGTDTVLPKSVGGQLLHPIVGSRRRAARTDGEVTV